MPARRLAGDELAAGLGQRHRDAFFGPVPHRVGVAGEDALAGPEHELALAGPAGAAQRRPDRPPAGQQPPGQAGCADRAACRALRRRGPARRRRGLDEAAEGARLLADRQPQLQVGDGDRGLQVGGAGVGRVGGEQLQLHGVAAGEAVALRVELEDDVVAAVAGRSSPRATSRSLPSGRTSSRRAARAESVPVVARSAITVGEPSRVKPGRRDREAVVGGRRPGRRRRRWRRRRCRRSGRRRCRCSGRPRPARRSGPRRRRSGSRPARGTASRRLRRGPRRGRRRRSSAPQRARPGRRRRPSGSGRTRRSGARRKSASSAGLFWLRAWPSSIRKSEIGSPGYWARVRL